MRSVIEIPRYGQLYQELLPYVRDASDRTVLDFIVSDFNEMLKSVRYNVPDVQPALGLMEFLVNSAEDCIDFNKVDRDILKLWCVIMDDVLYTLSQYPGWSVKSYLLVNCNSGYGAEIDKATMVLESTDVMNVPSHLLPQLDNLAKRYIESVIKQIETS